MLSAKLATQQCPTSLLTYLHKQRPDSDATLIQPPEVTDLPLCVCNLYTEGEVEKKADERCFEHVVKMERPKLLRREEARADIVAILCSNNTFQF